MRNASADFSPERSITVLSTFLFCVTSYWKIQKLSRDRRRNYDGRQELYPRHAGYTKNEEIGGDLVVSARCRNALSPATPYLLSFLKGLNRICTPETPDGFVLLCMAENKLAIDILSNRLQNPSTTVSAFSDPAVYCYNSFLGLPVARQAAAYFLAKRFFHTSNLNQSSGIGLSLEQALQSINPAHIGIGSGAVGILHGKTILYRIIPSRDESFQNIFSVNVLLYLTCTLVFVSIAICTF